MRDGLNPRGYNSELSVCHSPQTRMADRALISNWPKDFAVTNGVDETESVSLERAIEIATEAHRGQVDKANEPYILHSMRVMDQVDSLDQKIVGILHDVVEKNAQWSLSRLEDEGFKSKIIEAVDAMTRRAG